MTDFLSDLWYEVRMFSFLDWVGNLVRKYSAVHYALACLAVALVSLSVSVCLWHWSAVPALSFVAGIVFHIGCVCILGTLFRLGGELGHAEFRTRLLAFASGLLTGIFSTGLALVVTLGTGAPAPTWILIPTGLLCTAWGISFVVWAARRNNGWFRLRP